MDSAMQLLLTQRPEELTIRQITASVGLHHRYIPDYFGGKAELLAAIYGQVAQEAADAVTFPFAAGGIHPNIIRMARLALWLSANHPDGVPPTERPLQEKTTVILREQFGFNEEDAYFFFERLVASVLVLAAFPDVLGPNPVDMEKHIALELRILTMYATSQSARPLRDDKSKGSYA